MTYLAGNPTIISMFISWNKNHYKNVINKNCIILYAVSNDYNSDREQYNMFSQCIFVRIFSLAGLTASSRVTIKEFECQYCYVDCYT